MISDSEELERTPETITTEVVNTLIDMNLDVNYQEIDELIQPERQEGLMK